MKKLFLLALLLAAAACSRSSLPGSPENSMEIPDLTPDAFVAALLDDSYAYAALPAFQPEDIEGLLAHRLDTRPVRTYPVNPISSYSSATIPLGYVVLWAVENIRQNHPYEGSAVHNYPSLNPVLQVRAGAFQPITDESSLGMIAAAYQAWWINHRNQPFGQARLIDPLGETELRWH